MEVHRIVTVTPSDIETGQPIVAAIKRTWPEAKYVSVVNGETGINFSEDDPAPFRGCLYVTMPAEVWHWHLNFQRAAENPDMKLVVGQIMFGLCFDGSFLKPKHHDRLSNDTTLRPRMESIPDETQTH